MHSINYEFMLNITGSILEHNKSGGVFENANAGTSCIYDRLSVDYVSINLYSTVIGLGCETARGSAATMRGCVVQCVEL